MTHSTVPVSPEVGSKVNATVVRVAAAGVMVFVEPKYHGIIRNRELSWDRTAELPKVQFTKNTRLDVVVLEFDPDRDWLELSLKRAHSDPWDAVRRGEYSLGRFVRGEVVNFQHYGAFVQLAPGIDGLLPKTQIPGGESKEIEDLVWIGDHIEALVTEVDEGRQRIHLSIKLLRERLRTQDRSKTGQPQIAVSSKVAKAQSIRLSDWINRTPIQRRIRRVLVVDNEEDFVNSFVDWLRRLGYETKAVLNGATAIAEASSCDLLFLDINLPDIDGVEVAKTIRKTSSEIEIVFITGLIWDHEIAELPEDLNAAAVLWKPLNYGEVLETLLALETPEFENTPDIRAILTRRDTSLVERLSTSLQKHDTLAQRIEALLTILVDQISAEKAVIFEVDSFKQTVSIVASRGLDPRTVDSKDMQALRFSEVRNVAVVGEEIHEGAAAHTERFQALLRLVFFESCIAVPVRTGEQDRSYGLFLFHSEFDRFTSARVLQTQAAAYLIAVALREHKLELLIQDSQRYLLAGQIAASLFHEVKNSINTMEVSARLLELDCQELALQPRSYSPYVWSEKLGKRTERVLDANESLRLLAQEYLGLFNKRDPEPIDVNEIIQQTVRQISSNAKDNSVRILTRYETRRLRTTAIPNRLEQVFLNLELNAMQQMATNRPRGGVLEISTRYDSQNPQHPIRVLFTDEGPGVHRRLWNWIFEMGTSTRQHGTGLGLYVSKGLIEAMGGRLSIDSSYMFVGSALLVELPVI